tara:strand:+ start:16579 stop:17826 length:1248 start_codon:yes stop_codon:yes gene_type:complete
MLRNVLFYIGILISLFSAANNNLQYHKIKFPTGVIKLTESVMKQASDIYNSLPERNFTRIRLEGEDEEHWAKFDKIQLAKKRAFSIREFFMGIGCASKNVKLDLSGGMSILLFKPKAFYSMSGRINLNKIEQQCFKINTNEQSYFKTKSGNIFVFKPNSFISENGFIVNGEVNICVWEFFKQKDMIVSELTSGGEDEVLETASTFYIQGFQDKMKLKLQNGKSYKIYLNRPEDADGFKAYYGTVQNGNVKWLEDKRSYAYTSMFDEGELMEKRSESSTFKVRSNDEENEKMSPKKLLLTGKRIGWINCDRIVNVKNPSDLDIVLEGVNEEFTVRMALNRRNAIVPGLLNSNYSNQYKFSKIPSGESGHVIAYKSVEGGYMVAYSQVTIGFIKSVNLKPAFKSQKEFEVLLESFLH